MIDDDDLVLEVLSRLPTKSLRRFRCVSKPWSNLISYVFLHRQILLPMSGFLISVDHQKPTYASIAHDREKDCRFFQSRIQSLPFPDRIAVIDSCNGLLLFMDLTSSTLLYYLWNPATGEFLALPKPPEYPASSYHWSLAFDPNESPHYKVIQFTDSFVKVGFLMYSSMTGSWVEFDVSCPLSLEEFDPVSVFHKGAFHMLAIDDDLLRLDIGEATFHLTKLPTKHRYDGRRTASIWEFGGQLYYVANIIPMFEIHIYMHDEGNSENWVLMHTVNTEFLNHHPLIRRGYNNSLTFRPIGWHPQSKVIFLDIKGKIVSYHFSSGKLEETSKKLDHEEPIIISITPCLESMNPPGGKYINPLDFMN